MAFSTQRLSTTSPAQTVTLTNSGGAPLNLTSITITGAQAADFAFAAGNTCPTGASSVAPGASCTISVSFTPAGPGVKLTLIVRSEEHTSELQSRQYLVCRLLLEKKKYQHAKYKYYYI